MELTVTRRSIETEVASCEMLDGKIGYIKIANFDNRCANETIDCIEQLLAQARRRSFLTFASTAAVTRTRW